MSCDLVDARMRIRPRESSLSHPFTAASFLPPSQGEQTAPWLDRAPNAVPAWLAAMLHDERNRSSTRDACDQLLPTTLRRRVPTSRSAIRRCLPLRGPPDAWRVSRRPTHFGCKSVLALRGGRFLPATSTDCDPLTLPSPRTACPLISRTRRDWLSPIRGDPPAHDGNREVSASTRPRPSAHDDAREGSPQVLMIRSAFHRTGDRSRLEGCPSLRFASARRPGLPVCCAHPRR